MTYRDMFMISLYRVIGRIGMMTLHLGMMNKGSDMGGRTWDCFCDVLAKIRCPRDLGVGICIWLAYMHSESFKLLFMTWKDVIRVL